MCVSIFCGDGQDVDLKSRSRAAFLQRCQQIPEVIRERRTWHRGRCYLPERPGVSWARTCHCLADAMRSGHARVALHGISRHLHKLLDYLGAPSTRDFSRAKNQIIFD